MFLDFTRLESYFKKEILVKSYSAHELSIDDKKRIVTDCMTALALFCGPSRSKSR